MPKKKKSKESSSTTEFKFDYRYTPKPYFTAPAPNVPHPLASPLNRGSPNRPNSTPASVQRNSGAGFNNDTWQSQRQISYGYNRNTSYAKAATETPNKSSNRTTPSSHRQSSLDSNGAVQSADSSNMDSAGPNEAEKTTMRTMFCEMFKGRVESAVIDMVLQEENWNENQALDVLSQLAPEDNSSHLGKTLTAADVIGFGAITPDHNLTPTAPTLSYCSSMTSLDEYGLEYVRDVTQRNLSQVADVLRNNPDDINDLDRQRLARSRAATPKTLHRNGTMTLKNITLGSTESLESNRSHYDVLGGGYASASLSREGTPKKSNFEKTMSLYDISGADADDTLTLSLPRVRERSNTLTDSDTTRSDPGVVESLLIPLEHGDIVLEKGTYDQLDGASSKSPTPTAENQAEKTGPLTHSVSVSDYSQAIHSLITQLDSDPTNNSSSSMGALPDHPQTSTADSVLCPEAVPFVAPPTEVNNATRDESEPSLARSVEGSKLTVSTDSELSDNVSTDVRPRSSNKGNIYPYNGILSSGTAVPTAFESARPKKPRASPLSPNSQSDEALQSLIELSNSGQKVMFLLRGVPGCGKTTLARRLLDGTEGAVFSGDDFFTNSRGEYLWDSNKLPEAHAWNQSRVRKAAEAGVTPIVVDNTHTQAWEMEPCVKTCLVNGYRPVLAEPTTSWRYKAKELAKKNSHGVPQAKIKLMLERFEHTVTVEQIINKITRRDPTLLSMAEQVRSMSTTSTHKLSRKKPASKTIRRNKQHDTVEKLKDKKVEELTTQLLTTHSSPSKDQQRLSLSEDDDNQMETEIKYPSLTNGLHRKPTVKVLNCETRTHAVKVPLAKSSHDVSKLEKSVPRSNSMTYAENEFAKSNLQRQETVIEREVDIQPTSHDNNETYPAASRQLTTRTDEVKVEPIKIERIKMPPLSTSPLFTQEPSNLGSSSDSAIGESTESSPIDRSPTSSEENNQSAALIIKMDQSQTTSHSTDQSGSLTGDLLSQSDSGIETEKGKPAPIVGSSATLPRPSSKNTNHIPETMSHSATLTLKKTKKSSSSTRRSKSTTLLTVDKGVKERWMANDWAVPPYPVTSSPDTATVDPPPPYSEFDEDSPTATVKPMVTSESSHFVKTKEGGTLTEPSDYAMAYKAMQHNQQLPEGWVLLTGHSREPYQVPEDFIPYKSSVVTHEKGTAITEDDTPDKPHVEGITESNGDSAELSSHRERQIQQLHSCFPQLTETQLSEFLDLCQGDETWATNLLLDSNKLSLPKPKKTLNKVRSKPSLSKSSIVRRFNKAMVPVTSCLKSQEPVPGMLSAPQECMNIRLTVSQASDLHTVFGQGTELPSTEEDEYNISVPTWLARRIHRCMIASLNPDSADPNTNLSTNRGPIRRPAAKPTVLPVTPKRPPRHRKKPSMPTREPVISAMRLSESRSDTVDGPDTAVTGASADHTADDYDLMVELSASAQSDTAYQKADEELARRLQSEDLLEVIRSSPLASPSRPGQAMSSSSMTMIADEQYARSLAKQEIKSSMSQPDLSAQLKRQKLYKLYPGADKTFLDEIFESCRYNLDQSLQILGEVRGPPNPSAIKSLQSTPDRPTFSKSVMSPNSTSNSSRESTPSREMRTAAAASDADDDQWYDVDDHASVLDNPEYQDYRAEANLHLQKRTECLQKAAAARKKGMGDVSIYYTQLAEHHRVKSREADFSAASRIFEDKNRFRDNNEVDLHGLHTHESVALLEQVIQLKQREGKMKYINIITGRGNRSKGGVARVKQAVVNYLDNKRISYRVENGGGMIRVAL